MKATTVRIPADVHEALSLSAGRNYRSLHGEILEALSHYAKKGCVLSDCKITRDERDHLFDNGPDYKQLAKNRKEKIKELEQTVGQLEQTIYELENPNSEEPIDVTDAGIWQSENK